MTLKDTLGCARRLLDDGGIDDAAFEGELLLRHALGLSRAGLYSDLESHISPQQQDACLRAVQRRLSGEPSAYITGRREFYGLEFSVNRHVLISRPESELLVDKALALAANYKEPLIADIGTGSGAIAVSLAVNLPQAVIYAVDISHDALKVASTNCRRHGVADRVRLICGDMLQPLSQPLDIIVANLPYVKPDDIADACPEPSLALNGGVGGLEKIKRLVYQVEGKLNPGGSLLLEIGLGQTQPVSSLLGYLFPDTTTETIPDLAGIDRVVCMTLPY
jgi:release factor glutamine methyltransferase